MYICITLLTTLRLVVSTFCDGKPDPNAKINLNTIIEANPRFIRAVPNGQLYHIGEGDDIIPVSHLWGSPYQKGFARGLLHQTDLPKFMDGVWNYLESEASDSFGDWIPKNIKNWISNVGLETALDLTWLATSSYTGDYFMDEMKGMADATNYSVDRIRRIHMIGELTKGSCSMIGAWGKALGKDGLITVRALDWSVDGPFRDYPELVIYHAQNSKENTFLNMGWVGWIGSISGVSQNGLSIHEIGVAHPDDSFGLESRIGIPFTFLLRDILQFDKNQEESVNRIRNAHRTCNLILGVGSGSERLFNSMAVSASAFILNADKNMTPIGDWHPRYENVIYHAMDWICPYFSKTMATLLQKYYGKITHETIIREILPITSTGNLHVYIADLVNQEMWVANAQRSGGKGSFYAFDRPYIHLNLTQFWFVNKVDSINE